MSRPRELAREAYRNLGWQHLLLAVSALLALTGAALLLNLQAQSSVQQELHLRQNGSPVWSIAADEDSPFPAAMCAAVAQSSGVAAAGGVLTDTPPSTTVIPGSQQELPITLMTPNFPQVFVPETPPGVITVGSELVELNQVSLGQPIWIGDERRAALEYVLPSWTPISQLSAGIGIPVAYDGAIAECWVRMDPGAAAAGGELLRAWFGAQLRVTQFAPPASSASPWQQWTAIAQLHPGLLAGLCLCLISAALHWNRRAEYGVRRVFGSTSAEIAAMSAIESALVIMPTAMISVGLVAVAALFGWITALPQTMPLAVTVCAAGGAIAVAGSSLLARAFARTSPVDTLRDR